MKYIIGVDPGASGAIAILEDTGKLVHVFDMPSVEIISGGKAKRRVSPEMLAAELRLYADQGAVAYVEQVGAMPGQGVSSMFAFGQAFGIVLGVMAGLAIPTQTVTPAKWKKDMKLNQGKDAARAKATVSAIFNTVYNGPSPSPICWPVVTVTDSGNANLAHAAEFSCPWFRSAWSNRVRLSAGNRRPRAASSGP